MNFPLNHKSKVNKALNSGMVKGSDQEFFRELCYLQTQWETTQPSWLSSPEHTTRLSSPLPAPGLWLCAHGQHRHGTASALPWGPGKELWEKPHFLVLAKSTLQGCLGTWVTTILWPDFLAWPQMCLIPADVSSTHGLSWPWSLSPELCCPHSGSVRLPCLSARSLPEPPRSQHPRSPAWCSRQHLLLPCSGLLQFCLEK